MPILLSSLDKTNSYQRRPESRLVKNRKTALRRLALLLPLLLSVVFTALLLLPELRPVASLNDDAFHFLLVQGANKALSHGNNPFDFWSPVLELGFPQFLYYQHLPHLVVVLIYRLLFGLVPLITVFNVVRLILLAGLPVTVYWSLRKLGFSAVGAGAAAAFAPLFSGNFNYGFEYDSYIWSGFGMYTQLWAMHLSFLCLALLHDFLERGRGLALTTFALAALILSHVVYAYMMAISSAILLVVVMTRTSPRLSLRRFLLVWILAAGMTAYFWLPFLASRVYISASPYLQQWKYNSFGAAKIMTWLTTGKLFDYGRPPVITILVALGCVAAARKRTRLAAYAISLFLVWLALYFGRTTWGSLLDFLPMHNKLIMHRFVGSVDIAAVLLVALGTDWLFEYLALRWQRLGSEAVFVALTIVLMLPALIERYGFYQHDARFINRSVAALKRNPEMETLAASLAKSPSGRTFSGLRTGWGQKMKFGDLAFSDLLTFHMVPQVSPPYQSLSLNADLLWDFNFRRLEDYELFNVRHVVAPRAEVMPPFLQRAGHIGDSYDLYAVKTGGDFTLARSDVVLQGKQRDLLPAARVWHESMLPAAHVFPIVALQGAAQGPPSMEKLPLAKARQWIHSLKLQPRPHGQVHELPPGDQKYSAIVNLLNSATLVLKVTFHPNWHATVDGSPVRTMMVMPSYIGIPLSPGKHRIIVEYRSAPERTMLMAAGMAFAVLALILARKSRRNETI